MDAHWAASDAIYSLVSQFSVFLLVIGFFLLYDRLNRDSKGGKRLIQFMNYNSLSTPAILFVAVVSGCVILVTESVTAALFVSAMVLFILIAGFPIEIRENGIYALHRKWFMIKCDLIPWETMKQYQRHKHKISLTLHTGKKIGFTIPPKIGPKVDAIMKRKMHDAPAA